jgi:hypothetical protein
MSALGTSRQCIGCASAALLEALEAAERALSAASIADKSLYAAPVTLAARAAIRQAKGEKNDETS